MKRSSYRLHAFKNGKTCASTSLGFSNFVETGELHQPEGEDRRDEAVTAVGDVAGCRHNGDAGPDAAEEEPRQEEERNVDKAADSPTVGQQ